MDGLYNKNLAVMYGYGVKEIRNVLNDVVEVRDEKEKLIAIRELVDEMYRSHDRQDENLEQRRSGKQVEGSLEGELPVE